MKHSGDVRVVIGGKNGSTEKIEVDDQADEPDHLDVLQNGIFKCKHCPYSVDSQADFDNHLQMHVPKNDFSMKCYFCSYYVSQKYDLFDHLRLHGVINPEDYINRAMQGRELVSPTNFDGQTFKRYKCVNCPYVSNSKSQFLYHKQFHRHRGGPFKCEYCSYNVTRRHLLHQHLKVHGIHLPSQKGSGKSGSDRESDAMDSEDVGLDEFEEIMSPTDQYNFDDQQILLEVPLVWVSRDGKFSKMYKCRFCPHVNMRKVNIQEHEKRHSLREKNSNLSRSHDEHHCSECSYICNNAGVLSSHLKVHQEEYGQIHCLVDTNKTDEEQITELTHLLSVAQRNSESSDTMNESRVEEALGLDNQDINIYKINENEEKMLYFCQHCPGRFLYEKEYNIHNRFHGPRLFYRCEYCSYAARQRPHLLSHGKVHTDEYQEKTKLYKMEFGISKEHPQPDTAVMMDAFSENTGPIWAVVQSSAVKSYVDQNENNTTERKEVVTKQSNKNFACKKCPARFFKNELLKYHMTLHGCNNPYKCKFCDYAARTSSNLQKHMRIHDQPQYTVSAPVMSKQRTTVTSSKVVPLSGTDLFQQKSEAQRQSNEIANQKQTVETKLAPIPLHIDSQFGTLSNGNPKFIYPTYLKNGRMKEKRYKCHKCPSAFEKREQYKVHLSLHGSKQRYKCENCDYSVKYYANYVQHTRKHQINADAQAAKKVDIEDGDEEDLTIQGEDGASDSGAPLSKLAIKSMESSSKRGPLKLSVADRQTLMILQLRRASSASSTKDSSAEDKKLFWCPHCPYTSYRKDAVDNHVNRHISVSGVCNNYTCEHCDYTVPQSHFLREHVKLHFMPQKTHQPEGYMVYENMELTSKSAESDDSSNEGVEESIFFSDLGENGKNASSRFIPQLEVDDTLAINDDEEEKIYINPESGEVVENSASVSVKSETKEHKKSH